MLSPLAFGCFEDAYVAVLEHVGQRFEHVTAPRGNAGRECLNLSFVLEDPRDRVVYAPARRANIVFCFAEALWYLRGRSDLEMMSYYAPRLARYSADGRTLTGSAYGPKIFAPDRAGRSQWDTAVALLAGEPGSKRAVISLFGAQELTGPGNPDVSCTLALQFMLRGGDLHAAAYMRGNDAYIGLLSDVFAFTIIQEFTARYLGAELGSYAHHAGSMHINDTDTAKAARVVAAARPAARRFAPQTMPPTTWAQLEAVEQAEGFLRRDEGQLDPGDVGNLGLAPYWQQVVLLFEAYRQISRHPGTPVRAGVLQALEPCYRWLLAHRWPEAVPANMVMPGQGTS